MNDLLKIKRLIIAQRYVFTGKAELEMVRDHLSEELVLESILNANGIRKRIRSTSATASRREYLYIIESYTYDGLLVYSKGAIKHQPEGDVFYLFVSSKRSISSE